MLRQITYVNNTYINVCSFAAEKQGKEKDIWHETNGQGCWKCTIFVFIFFSLY